MDKVITYLETNFTPKIEGFINSVKKELKEELSGIKREIQGIREEVQKLDLRRERMQGELKNYGEKINSLPCKDHKDDIQTLYRQTKGLQERALGWEGEVKQAKENEKAIAELKPQIAAIEKMLIVKIDGEEKTIAEAVKDNAKVNKEQETRRQKAEKNIWMVISGVLIILITSATIAVFNHFWTWETNNLNNSPIKKSSGVGSLSQKKGAISS